MGVQFFQPTTVDDAVGLLSAHGPNARALAGGTDLVVHARIGRATLPETIVHLGKIAGLDAIAVNDVGVLHLGATASHNAIEQHAAIRQRWTALAEASAMVGSPATRHMGTVGGNLVNGSPAMETGGPLLAFDASVRLVGPAGERTIALKEFFQGPGKTALAGNELLAGVIVPPLPGAAPGGAVGVRSGSSYVRLEFRRAMEIAIAGVTAAITLNAEGEIIDCRLALTAVAPVILRVPAAEESLHGQLPTEDVLARAGELAAAASSPIDDVRSPADYRRDMIRVYTVRALRRAIAACA
jgi:CO/xanthine dehydrogenase FAD-binding subunit